MLEWARDIGMATFVLTCLVFYAELIGGVLMFSFFFKRKPRFVPRLIGSIIVTCGLTILTVCLGYMLYERSDLNDIGALSGLGAIVFVYLVLMLSASIGIQLFCFRSDTLSAVFCGVCGYSVQHIVYRINMLFEYYLFFGSGSLWYIPLRIATIAVVYVSAWLLFAKKLKGYSRIDVENKRVVVVYCIVLAAMILFSGLSMFYIGAPGMRETPMVLIECGLAFIACVMALFTLHEGVKKRSIERDKQRIEWLWKADRKQYELAKAISSGSTSSITI